MSNMEILLFLAILPFALGGLFILFWVVVGLLLGLAAIVYCVWEELIRDNILGQVILFVLIVALLYIIFN